MVFPIQFVNPNDYNHIMGSIINFTGNAAVVSVAGAVSYYGLKALGFQVLPQIAGSLGAGSLAVCVIGIGTVYWISKAFRQSIGFH